MITRISLANEIDEYDQQIADMNSGKKDCFDAYRQQLIDSGMEKAAIKAEIEAVKAAIKRRRAAAKDEAALEEKDALVDEIFAEITRRSVRGAHARENVEKFDAETGEVFDTRSPRSAAEAVSERTTINQPETANETVGGFLVAAAPTNAEETGAIQSTRQGAGMERGVDQGVTGGESAATPIPAGSLGRPAVNPAVVDENHGDNPSPVASTAGTNSPIAPASHGQAEAKSPEAEEGDSNEVAHDHSHVATAGTRINHIVPATKPKTARDFRPNCLKPDACGASGLDHCYACRRAMKAQEEFA